MDIKTHQQLRELGMTGIFLPRSLHFLNVLLMNTLLPPLGVHLEYRTNIAFFAILDVQSILIMSFATFSQQTKHEIRIEYQSIIYMQKYKSIGCIPSNFYFIQMAFSACYWCCTSETENLSFFTRQQVLISAQDWQGQRPTNILTILALFCTGAP